MKETQYEITEISIGLSRAKAAGAFCGRFSLKTFQRKYLYGAFTRAGTLFCVVWILLVLSGIQVRAEDKIAADTQFNGNMALTLGGEYAIAEDAWKDFLKKYPGNSQSVHAEHYLAICCYHTRHFAEAEAIFEKEISQGTFPGLDESIFYLGVTLLEHAQTFPRQHTGSRRGTANTVGDRRYSITEDAAKLYQRSISQFHAIRNKYPDSKFRLKAIYFEGLAFIQLGNYESALGDLKLAVAEQHFSELNDALYALAEVYLNLKKPEERNAISTLQTLLDYQPCVELRLRAKRLLSDIYFRLGNYEAAEKQFHEIESDPDFKKWLDPKTEDSSVLNLAFYYYRFGEIYVKQKRYDLAAEQFALAATNYPKSEIYPHALYQQALAMKNFNILLKKGEKDKAFDETQCAELWMQVLEVPGVKKDRALLRSATHRLAMYYLQKGEPEKALEMLDSIPKKLRTTNLLRDRADALAGCGRRDEAVTVYRQIFQKNQTPKTLLDGADAMLQIVQIYAKEKNWEGVIQVSGEVIIWDGFKRLPEIMQMTFLEENTNALYAMEDYTAARDGWLRLLDHYAKIGTPDDWRISIAYCHQKKGHSQEACEFISYVVDQEKLIKAPAKIAEIRHLWGVCARDCAQQYSERRSDFLKQARNQLIKAKNLARDVGYSQLDKLYYDLCMVYFLQEDYENCVKNVKRGLKACPDSPICDQLFFLKGRCEVQQNNLKTAARTFEKFLEKYPNSPNAPEAGLLASQCFLKLNQTEKAVKLAKEVATRFPNSNFQERGANVQAIAAMEAADYDSAMEAWNIILESNSEECLPLHPEASYEIGYCLYEKKEFEKAEAAFRKVLEKYPDWDSLERTYNQLVKVLLEQKKLQEAQDVLAEMSGKFPESVFIRPLTGQLGIFWFLEGNMEAAEAALRPILKEANAELDFIRRSAEVKTSWAFYNRKMFQETLDFVSGLNLNPEIKEGTSEDEKAEILESRAEIRFLKAMAHFQLRNLSQALKEFQELLKDPSLRQSFRENTLEMMVQIYEEKENWESVLETSEEFLEVYPSAEGKNRMMFKRAMAFFKLQKFDETLALCEALEAANDPIFTMKAIFLKGEILFARKQYEQAIQAFYQVIYGIKEPKLQADAMFEAAQCFEMLGKVDKALKHYHELLETFPNSDKVKLAKRKMSKLND